MVLSGGDAEYVSVMSSVVRSVCMSLADVLVVVVRAKLPLPFLGGFLVIWGLGHRVVLLPEVIVATSSTTSVRRNTGPRDDMLEAW